MQNYRRLLFALLCLITLSGMQAVQAESMVVIVAADDPRERIDVNELASIYRRKVRFDSDGRPLVPVNLPATHPLRRVFSLALFGRLPEDLQEYWNGQYFHGISPPLVLESEEAVLRFVGSTPGAIGYVLKCNADKRVKALVSLSVPNEGNTVSHDCRETASGQ